MDGAGEDALAHMTSPARPRPAPPVPARPRARLRPASPVERLDAEIRRGTDVVGILPDEAAATRLAGAVPMAQTEERAVRRPRRMTPEPKARAAKPPPPSATRPPSASCRTDGPTRSATPAITRPAARRTTTWGGTRRSIHRRPDTVAGREQFGNWEVDLMILQRSHGSANVATVVERKTRYVALYRNEDRRSRRVLGRLAGLLGPLPAAARRSVTFDRGLEFLAWRGLIDATGIDVWFRDPQAPHQKGAVENANGRVRRRLPSETPVADLAEDALAKLCARLNGTPRKCLGYATPAGAFAAEMERIT